MRKRHVWIGALAALLVLVAACGPQMATPTPSEIAAAESSPAPTEEIAAESSPTASQPEAPTSEPEASPAPPPVDEDDWHVLGSPDASVTIIEYSDFQ